MKKLEFVPRGLSDINSYYGNPDRENDGILDRDFVIDFLDVFTLPFPVVLSWQRLKRVSRIQMHQAIAPAVLDALTELADTYGTETLRAREWDVFGGCFSWRAKRGGIQQSTHCWGIAIDWCPDLGPYGEPEAAYPQELSEVFTERGFIQLRHDKMHFQACTGY